MKFTRLLIAALAIATQFAPIANATTAAKWADNEKAKLDGLNQSALIEIAKGAPQSYRQLFAEVKSDYKSDPLEITRIAALTQIIASKAKPATRSQYADELLAAATKAEAADVACFFIDQLRWCATKKQTKGIRELTKSDKKEVAAIAAIAMLASERDFESQQKDVQANIYSEYSAQIAKLRGTRKTKALMDGFDNADIKIAGLAMREAAQIDIQDQINGMGARKAAAIHKKRHSSGKQDTKLWCEKLSTTSDPLRQIMLLNMLGKRGNPEAVTTLAEYVGYADIGVSKAAQQALLKIDPPAYVAALPPVLKNLPASHTDLMKNSMRCVPVELIENTLIKDYSAFSQAGKNVTMETLKLRRSAKGVTLALEAINSSVTEESKNGYRLLRDCAGPDEAEALVRKLATRGRIGNAQSAVAAAAKRDTTGTYARLLEKAWPKAGKDHKLNLLGTFNRIGDKKLLALTTAALKDEEEEIVTAAVRALSAWDNNDAVNTLLKIAYTAEDNKQRVLAQRGVEKKLSAKGVDKAPYKNEWRKISAGAGNADMKKKLDAFFAK